MAAALTAAAPAQEAYHQAELGVTATVVRPPEVSAPAPALDGAVAIIRNAALIDVVAEGGRVRLRDDEIAIVPSNGSSLVTVTLIF